MLSHALASYPEECCGAMLGESAGDGGTVRHAVRLENSAVMKDTRYELHLDDLRRAGDEAEARGMELIGIYHSHPDEDADFSAADLAGSWPWFSFLVLSVCDGELGDTSCWRPNLERTEAAPQLMVMR
jgi:proteasome lid subunit RPN8/RPN11